MVYDSIPVPHVTEISWVEYELASMSLERQRSMNDRSEPFTFDFSTVDLSLLEKAGLV